MDFSYFKKVSTWIIWLRAGGVEVVELIGEFERALGVDGELEVHNAFETPGGVDRGLNESSLVGGFGVEVVQEFVGEGFVGGAVVGGEDDGFAG